MGFMYVNGETYKRKKSIKLCFIMFLKSPSHKAFFAHKIVLFQKEKKLIQ